MTIQSQETSVKNSLEKKEKEERGKRTENTSNHAPIKISSLEKDKRLGQLYQY